MGWPTLRTGMGRCNPSLSEQPSRSLLHAKGFHASTGKQIGLCVTDSFRAHKAPSVAYYCFHALLAAHSGPFEHASLLHKDAALQILTLEPKILQICDGVEKGIAFLFLCLTPIHTCRRYFSNIVFHGWLAIGWHL